MTFIATFAALLSLRRPVRIGATVPRPVLPAVGGKGDRSSALFNRSMTFVDGDLHNWNFCATPVPAVFFCWSGRGKSFRLQVSFPPLSGKVNYQARKGSAQECIIVNAVSGTVGKKTSRAAASAGKCIQSAAGPGAKWLEKFFVFLES